MGGSNVRGRHGDPLVAHQLETPLPALVQRHAVMADRNRRLRRDRYYLSIRLRGDATVYLFPVLV